MTCFAFSLRRLSAMLLLREALNPVFCLDELVKERFDSWLTLRQCISRMDELRPVFGFFLNFEFFALT